MRDIAISSLDALEVSFGEYSMLLAQLRDGSRRRARHAL
jgi:hypothetical protein